MLVFYYAADEETNESGELDLEGIDDNELDQFILSDDEVRIKTTIWMRANADFLKELKGIGSVCQFSSGYLIMYIPLYHMCTEYVKLCPCQHILFFSVEKEERLAKEAAEAGSKPEKRVSV